MTSVRRRRLVSPKIVVRGERERQGETDRRETDRERRRQTRQTEREKKRTDRERQRQRDGETDRERQTERERERERERDRQTERETDRETDRQREHSLCSCSSVQKSALTAEILLLASPFSQNPLFPPNICRQHPHTASTPDGRGAELLEYRWLRLEDGTSNQPIMVKLFSTSQPESHRKLHPLSVVVCSRLKLIRAEGTDVGLYLTNSAYTQVYCTGLGHHSEMSYRKLQPVRRFLRWMRSQDDGQVLSRALIGGSFTHPPPPVSLETYMKDRRGEPGFLRGAELQREVERLCYRERRTFCIQAAVTMVTYSRRGEEDRCLFWTDRPSSLSPLHHLLILPLTPSPSPSLSPSSYSSPLPLPSTPRSFRPPLSSSSSFSPTSPSSAVSPLAPPRPPDRSAGKSRKRKLLQPQTPNKRHPWVTLQPEQNNKTVILFEASMEFLENTNADEEEDDDDEDTSSFVTAPLHPSFSPVAAETLPMRYDHGRREEQADAVEIGGRADAIGTFDSALEDYYTLRLRALSDGVSVDAIFLPHSSSSSPPLHHHANTWISILSHGAFSSHTPPPSPGDLIGTAPQLSNQRLVCVLEACHLGGATTELILSRAFHLTD
uniref:Uncharacterized protein n=1 Tax=Dicentrarchus labrax TaxID=13489 RepID=A0A8P4GV28_DICLA